MRRNRAQPGKTADRQIRLAVPGTLEYRDLAIRVVAAACKLAHPPPRNGEVDAETAAHRGEFDNQVISAFSEAFNNIAIHAYQDRPLGTLEMEIELEPKGLTIRIIDYGASFDFLSIPLPDFGALPESGFGLYIIKSFMDEVSYQAGSPNVLSISKWYKGLRQRFTAEDHAQGSQGGSVP